MKVVLLSEMYSPGMGYLENMFPKYLAKLGVEAHVVTTKLPPYYQLATFKETYGEFAKSLSEGMVEKVEGYTLHVVGHRKVGGYVRMTHLAAKLKDLRPDIVQTMVAIGWIPIDAAFQKLSIGYKLFTGNHLHASVFPLATRRLHPLSKEFIKCAILRTIPGRLVSLATEKCYAISPDSAEIAAKFFGVQQKKIDISPLGVDTEIFSPSLSSKDERDAAELRQALGFSSSDIVCIYTGRFSEDKNPLLLARAVTDLRKMGIPFRALFLGNGEQKTAIQSCSGCVTKAFMPVYELSRFFRAADIGVWPTQESMSMLDAAACGLPIVVNDTVRASERYESNGMIYKKNDLRDLVRVLLTLRSVQLRRELGQTGALKMASRFSWDQVTRWRLRDYEAALCGSRSPRVGMEKSEQVAKPSSHN